LVNGEYTITLTLLLRHYSDDEMYRLIPISGFVITTSLYCISNMTLYNYRNKG